MLPLHSKAEVTEIVLQQATLMFGQLRAEALRSALEQRAEQMWMVFTNPPDRDDGVNLTLSFEEPY